MRSITQSILLAATLTSLLATASAQTPADNAALTNRLQQLEARTEALQQEVNYLRSQKSPQSAPTSQFIPTSQIVVEPTSYEVMPSDSIEPNYVTIDDLQAEIKKNTWRKGGFTITPYGRITVDTVYETSRSYPGDIILWATSLDDQGEDAFYIDAKSTRLGLKIGGPSSACNPCVQLGGCIEVDFQGQYVYHNKPGLLFRRGFIEMKNENFKLLAGQEWEILSPLYPGNLNYVPGSAVGNLGYRRAQLRYDRYFSTASGGKLTLQSSLNTDILQDFTSPTDNISPGVAGWPVIEGRMAWKPACGLFACAPAPEFGTSAHIGEVIYDFDTAPAVDDLARRTWSFNIDVQVPISQRMAVRGEFFTGENLSAYMGGILQGVNGVNRNAIRSTGGWFDVCYKWSPCLKSYAGYSIDDPINGDLTGMTAGRTYNQFYFANLIYNVTDDFTIGFDVSSWKTKYTDRRDGDLVRFQYQMMYSF